MIELRLAQWSLWRGLCNACLALFAILTFALGTLPAPAHAAVKAIPVGAETDRIEITSVGELYEGRGDNLQIEAAATADGVTSRMAVRAANAGTNPSWIAFALTNKTDKPVERWLAADRYAAVGAGVVWPNLDAKRLEAITPSLGFVPERIASDRADIFKITLDPGQTITYVAEFASERAARVYLWKPIDYEAKARDRQLFHGILLGITGLLAIFLTAVFAANHKAIFPSTALMTWCVLGYLCVDFGFFHKLFQLRPEDNGVYRAAMEAAVAASLVIFLHTFLRLGSWHSFVRMLLTVWILAQLALVVVAIIDPRLAATFARLSFLGIGGIGALLTLFLALRGQDRALALVPTWLLFLVWTFAAGVTLTGRLTGEVAVSGLAAGIVLFVVLVGFTVTQFAFRSLEPLYGAAPSDLQLRSQAIESAGAALWEWNARRDEVKVSPLIELTLGLTPGELSCKFDDFAKHLHSADKERVRLLLWGVNEKNGGHIRADFRLRHNDGSYLWFELEAASIKSAERRAVRCVGLMRDVTDAKRSQERLMHDAVHDSLTSLPNRELFVDRLSVAFTRAKTEDDVQPTLIFIDIDKFKSVNSSFGLVVGDSLLLTVARRLARHLAAQDTLARVGGDQFAILLIAQQDPKDLAMLAERVRRSLRSPIKINGQDIVLTASCGVAVYDGHQSTPQDLLKEAEIAMYRAKRTGADQIEIFRPEMRAERDDRVTIESDLRQALERRQLKVMYQPIIYLPTEELAGFEALVRWEHPKLGMLNPAEFVPVAEESDLIVKLGSYVLSQAAQDAARWQKELPRLDNPLFVSVNVSSRQLFRQDLIQEIRHIVGKQMVPPGCLRLEVTESLVMENPEQATEILEYLRQAGALLALDDFGSGYSSLAYLQRFPFDTIKIDKELVQASSGDIAGAGAAIVRSIVALSHELGKKVVAEGVEHGDDVGFLRSLGTEYAQGFYYGEAMPDKEVIALLRVIRKSERKLHKRGLFRTKMPGTQPDAAVADAAAAKAKARRKGRRGESAGDAANGAAAPGQTGGHPPVNGQPANGTSPGGPMPPPLGHPGRQPLPSSGPSSGPSPMPGHGQAGGQAGHQNGGMQPATVNQAPPPRPVLPPRIGNDLVPGAVRVRPRSPLTEPVYVPPRPRSPNQGLPPVLAAPLAARQLAEPGMLPPAELPRATPAMPVRVAGSAAAPAPSLERQQLAQLVRPSTAKTRPGRLGAALPSESANGHRVEASSGNAATAQGGYGDVSRPGSIAAMFPAESTASAEPAGVTPVPSLPQLLVPEQSVVAPANSVMPPVIPAVPFPPARPATPNLKGLPPAIAASLARLAGTGGQDGGANGGGRAN
jgi:diguanylate cyclase (GGDEF)-like protein/PAS domain S-box-containing protein